MRKQDTSLQLSRAREELSASLEKSGELESQLDEARSREDSLKSQLRQVEQKWKEVSGLCVCVCVCVCVVIFIYMYRLCEHENDHFHISVTWKWSSILGTLTLHPVFMCVYSFLACLSCKGGRSEGGSVHPSLSCRWSKPGGGSHQSEGHHEPGLSDALSQVHCQGDIQEQRDSGHSCRSDKGTIGCGIVCVCTLYMCVINSNSKNNVFHIELPPSHLKSLYTPTGYHSEGT